MTTDDRFTCLHCLLALAWVDGELADVERDFLKVLLDVLRASDITQEQREALDLWMTQAPPQPDWAYFEAHPELSQDIVKQATILAYMDMTVTAREISFLQRLRERVGLSEMVFYRIQSEAEAVIISQLGLTKAEPPR